MIEVYPTSNFCSHDINSADFLCQSELLAVKSSSLMPTVRNASHAHILVRSVLSFELPLPTTILDSLDHPSSVDKIELTNMKRVIKQKGIAEFVERYSWG